VAVGVLVGAQVGVGEAGVMVTGVTVAPSLTSWGR
jgi:hypothetical protein